MGLKILHIADLHWRGIARHEEYTRAFQMLFGHVKRIKPDLLYIGGDIFHTKTQGISPEVIEKMVWMFREMGDLVPTHVILGNHDGNLANEDRQDAISPLLHALNHPNIFLYKKSGVYPAVGYKETVMEGLTVFEPKTNFCVMSCFDKDNWHKVLPKEGEINIAMYHGSISGCETDTNWVIKEGEEDVTLFTGYDFAMLGDIHKQQWIASRPDKNNRVKPWVAYPGSMIQQNFGEDETKGFLVWDIRDKDDWDVEFVELDNQQPFVTVPWRGSVQDTVGFIKESRGWKAFIPGTRFRVSSSNTISQMESRQLQNELKDVYNASELTFKFETSTKVETIQTNSVNAAKTSLRNDVHTLKQLYREFLYNNHAKYNLASDQVDQAQDLITEYLNKFNASEAESPRDVTWSIKSMEFDNLFRYGEGNSINFENLEGIVGVFGSNRIGKSSIVGAMMYGLFNTTDRGPLKNGNIINYNKNYGHARVRINVAGTDYIIQRASKRAEPPKRKGKKIVENFDIDKTTTELSLWRCQPDGTLLPLNSVTRDDTDKEIRRLIGKPEDFLLTAFSNQGGINRFIEEGATQRKSILNRFLDLDLFERLFNMAKDDTVIVNNKTAKFTVGSFDDLIKSTEKAREERLVQLQEIEEEINGRRAKIDNLRLWLLQNKNEGTDIDPAALSKVQSSIRKIQLDLDNCLIQEAKLSSGIKQDNETITSTRLLLEEIDISDLRLKSETMSGIEAKVRELSLIYKESDNTLQGQEKSVKKLATVPCGDQFPECRFIKDSHEDKKSIEQQRLSVKELLSQLNSVTDTLTLYQQEKLAQKIADFEKMENNLKVVESGLDLKISKMETIKTLKVNHETELVGLKTRETELQERMSQSASSAYEAKKLSLKLEEGDLNTLEGRRNSTLVTIGTHNAKLESLQKDQAESIELLGKLKIYDSIQAAFSKNGIPAMILKTQLPAINFELSKLLSNVVDFKITLETDINSNVMDVFLEDAISRRIIELASGMEKMIASLALRVALINLSSLPKPDIFIIDEGFGVLDEEGIQKCMQLLSIMKTNFKTILVISHVSAIKEVADRIIEITNLGLESKVEV